MNFRAMRVAATTCAILTGTLLPVTSSNAFLGGFVGYLGFDVKAGLDSATRDFLSVYPENIRKQAVIGANEVLNRADESVARVFTQGRDLMLLGKEVVVCTGVTLENIPRGWGMRLFGIRPVYTQLLKDEINDVAKATSLTSKPGDIYMRYVSVDNLGRDAYCLTLQGDLDQQGVIQLRTEIKTTALLWKRLEALAPSQANPVGCTTVRECYALVSTTVDDSLKRALKQDKDYISANERMAAIERPPEPKSSWGSSNFNLRTYELAMLKMLAVHDDLLRVASQRIAKSDEEQAKLNKQISAVDSQIGAAEKLKEVAAACNQGYKLAPDVSALTKQFGVVNGYENLTPDEQKVIEGRITGLEKRRAALAAKSGKWVVNNGKSCSVVFREPRHFPDVI